MYVHIYSLSNKIIDVIDEMMTREEKKLQRLLDELPSERLSNIPKQPRGGIDPSTLSEDEAKEYWKKVKRKHAKAVKYLNGKNTRRKQHIEHKVLDELSGLRTGASWCPENYKCPNCYKEDVDRIEQFKIFEVDVEKATVRNKAFGRRHPSTRYIVDTYKVKCLHCREVIIIKRKRKEEMSLETRLYNLDKRYPITITA